MTDKKEVLQKYKTYILKTNNPNDSTTQEIYQELFNDIEQANKQLAQQNSPLNNVSTNSLKGPTKSLASSHFQVDHGNKAAFASTFILALLSAFASGAIVSAIYILINLGKVTISI